jgi:hypothetical protein
MANAAVTPSPWGREATAWQITTGPHGPAPIRGSRRRRGHRNPLWCDHRGAGKSKGQDFRAGLSSLSDRNGWTNTRRPFRSQTATRQPASVLCGVESAPGSRAPLERTTSLAVPFTAKKGVWLGRRRARLGGFLLSGLPADRLRGVLGRCLQHQAAAFAVWGARS